METQQKKLGFVRDTLEKVYRLVEILRFFESDELLSNALALKGGTAINLTIFDLPRLSIDIDLDYCKSVDREDMLVEREMISNKINKYMMANGYALSSKSKYYHALDSLVYEYKNAGGAKDNIKIETNYMLRCHVLPIERRKINLPWNDEIVEVLSLSPVEIFSSKTVALLSRTALRDLYDIYNMVKYGVINDDSKELYKKCVVFYSAISMEQPPNEFEFDNIGNVTVAQIRRDLDPVLRKSERFDLHLVQDEVKSFLEEVLIVNENEKMFWRNFSEKKYKPGLIFADEYDSIKKHPMALWKCRVMK